MNNKETRKQLSQQELDDYDRRVFRVLAEAGYSDQLVSYALPTIRDARNTGRDPDSVERQLKNYAATILQR